MDKHQTILPNYDSPDENKLDVRLKNYDNFVVHNWDNIEHAMLVVDGDDARDNSSNHDNDSSIVTASVVATAADYLHSKVLVDIRCVEERDDDCEEYPVLIKKVTLFMGWIKNLCDSFLLSVRIKS